MSPESTEDFSQSPTNRPRPTSANGQTTDAVPPANGAAPAAAAARYEVTVAPDKSRGDAATRENDAKSDKDPKASKDAKPRKQVSDVKVRMQNRLPALEDDGDVGVEKEQLVTRDGKADLTFMGVLLASAAPAAAPKGQWQEYRIYQTNGGKHVFSKVTRTIYAEDEDQHEAEVYDPDPASMSSKVMKSAREIAHARTLTWMDAAVSFFGYDPLAKALYRKLSVRFEEQIT